MMDTLHHTPSPPQPQTAPRHSPPRLPPLSPFSRPLAPLEHLQLNQRRGSITDPSLHASNPSAAANSIFNPAAAGRLDIPQSSSSPSASTSSTTSSSPFPRINPSFSFPAARTPENHTRSKLTRSPSSNIEEPKNNASPSNHYKTSDDMEQDEGRDSLGSEVTRILNPDFDYNMRRHSIATVPKMRSREHSPLHGSRVTDHPSGAPSSSYMPPPPLSGQKRKTSHDRPPFHAYGENTNVQPPLSDAMHVDAEDQGPPKRRGSAFEPRMSALTLYDRRDSIDSRASANGPSNAGSWNQNHTDRRDSSASLFSNSSGGYQTSSTSFSSDSHPFSQKSWPPLGPAHEGAERPFNGHSHPESSPYFGQNHAGSSSHPAPHPSSIPPLSFRNPAISEQHRRLSVPDVIISGASKNGTSLRPRGATRSDTSSNGVEGSGNGNSDDSDATQSPGHLAAPGDRSQKETPYSRSPELRVSHKLAERKRRKEMKELFDELRDQLPADRGMKASKWEILSKAVDYISQLKLAYTDVSGQLERMKHEMESVRAGGQPTPPAPPGHGGYPQSQYGPPPQFSASGHPAAQHSFAPGGP